jgi:hypothetical protein
MKPLTKVKPTPKPLIPVPNGASKAPFVSRPKVAPIAQPLRGKEHPPIKGNYDNGPAKKGDVIRMSKAIYQKVAPDALTNSKKFGKHVDC